MSESVNKMFAEIAGKYDLMNDILSLGIHHIWKDKLIDLAAAKTGSAILDCACGTGDIAFRFNRKVTNSGRVVGIDFTKEMIDIAKDRALQLNKNIDFQVGDATDLKFEDNSFDVSSISFGIRNVDSPMRCLREMARVVKPGGKVMVLEFGQPLFPISPIYNIYSSYIMPAIGNMIAGNKDAYTYLPQTAAKFPCREAFIKLMENSEAFSKREYYSLSFGIAYIYIGTVK